MYKISGAGAFTAGPLKGNLNAEILTDSAFNIDPSSFDIGGDAALSEDIAGNQIDLAGTVAGGSLSSLFGTVKGPAQSYTINASVLDNGGGYTIAGDGVFSAGPIQGSVHGTINTDPNFAPDFSSLNMGGQAGIDTEVAGNKVNVSAAVNNGYLENIAGTVEGPGGLYEINAKGTREGDKGYDVEAGGAFTFFEEKFAFEPPAIMLPAGVPGMQVNI